MDQYFLSNQPERFQMAQHFHSSLEEPNLDNVEAKLQATRQRNRQLAMDYFRTKYGSTSAYDNFARTHNLGEIKQQNASENDLRRHLELKAIQIANRFRDGKLSNHQHSQEAQEYHINISKPTKNQSGTNPWADSNKSNIKHKKQDSKFVDSTKSYPQHIESEFINDFKKFLAHKNTSKLNNESNVEVSNQSKIVNKKESEGIKASAVANPKKVKCYEQQLVKKIFADVSHSSGNSKEKLKVEKLALIEYLGANPRILKVLGMNEEQLNYKLMKEYETKFETEITQEEFLFFILKAVGKEKEINQIKQRRMETNMPSGFMLSEQLLHKFYQIFKNLDENTDLIVKRLEYIQKLAVDPMIKKELNLPAVYEPEFDKQVSLRRIFERIEMEVLYGSEEQSKIKEYISWNQFLTYFSSKSRDKSKYDLMLLIDSLKKQDRFELMEVPEIVMTIIYESHQNSSQGNEELFNTLLLIQQISKHPEYEHQKYTQVRQQSKISNLPSESFQEVLNRIKKNGQKYATMKQFLEYFTAKGRPIEQFEKNLAKSSKNNFSGVKVQFAQKNFKESEVLDGYDSDPQLYSSQLLNKNSPRRSGRSTKKLQTAKSFYEEQKADNENKKYFKVTIPQPFSFEEREKNRVKVQSVQKQSQGESYSQFKCRQIPARVLEVGLYEKMLEEDKKKIEERKKNSMIVTLANEKPFSFLNRKTNKKSKHEREQFMFKAKPIPWYCSVELLEKKKEFEIVRNEKIAKEAQQSLAKAKLPPRMERDYQQKLAKAALNEQKKESKQVSKPSAYRQPPNFDKLHRQFEEGLERKRKQNKTTKPHEFNFNQRSSTRPKTAVNQTITKTFVEQFIKHDDSYKKHLECKQVANSTLKFTQQVEKRRKEMQEKKKKEEQLMREEEKRLKVDEELKNKIALLTKNKENKQKDDAEARKQQMKEQNKKFDEWKKECVEKGRQQPMLVERPLKRDEKIEKMRKLYQISQTLKSNGIKGKDHDSYFKKDELILLQDWQLLKNKL